ncbi:MAG: tRNA pseudouridine(38-40) synthase TruA [Deltaproteobacteria bacterium]|nr:tRNA pseudouridine(38-40) synthase TruA [Deltaproteobacteria bacterium]
MRTIKIIVEYDGYDYHGWQRQKNRLTVQQVLEEKIGIIADEKIKVVGSGRTDAGVHALNQVAHFKTSSKLESDRLCYGINSLLPADIVIKQLTEVGDDFHAQNDAASKTYLYRIYNRPVRSVLHRHYAWHIPYALDVKQMQEAACLIIGPHDFSSFCATGTDVATRDRTVISVDIESGADGFISIWVEATGFLRYMVRNIVGTLVDVGRGKITPGNFRDILHARDRTKAGPTAPPYGLFLKDVKYLP